MLHRLFLLLSAPYPTYYSRWKAVVIPSLIIFFMLYVFRPFGIAHMGVWLLPAVLLFTLVSLLSSLFFFCLLPLLFPVWFDERHWTVGRHLLLLSGMLLLIAVGVWGVNCWLCGFWLDVSFLLHAVGWVSLLALFPTAAFAMWNQNLLLKRNLKDASAMNHALMQRLAAEGQEEGATGGNAGQRLRLVGDTRESLLEVDVRDVLYAESCGNYVKMVFRDSDERMVTSRLLRLTMKQVEEGMSIAPRLVRCHRAYIVNMEQVQRVEGNSQGYRLQLNGVEEEIPVSRAYTKVVKECLETLSIRP